MFFLTKFLSALTEPSNFLILLLVAGIVLCWRHRDAIGRPLILGSAAAMVALWLLPFEQWLAMPLEGRFARPPLPAHVDGIVVLGNGLEPRIFASRGADAVQPSDQRVVAGAELARQFPNAKLVFSGGSGDAFGGTSEASVARVLFAELGVAPRQVVLEDKSRTTWENLVFSKRLVMPKPGQTWILVTSAVHMPRAMGVAHRLGWSMVPWPAEYISAAHGRIVPRLNYADSTMLLQEAAHEWIGLVAYRLEGRTDLLLP